MLMTKFLFGPFLANFLDFGGNFFSPEYPTVMLNFIWVSYTMPKF